MQWKRAASVHAKWSIWRASTLGGRPIPSLSRKAYYNINGSALQWSGQLCWKLAVWTVGRRDSPHGLVTEVNKWTDRFGSRVKTDTVLAP
jgi:hypothetical protein